MYDSPDQSDSSIDADDHADKMHRQCPFCEERVGLLPDHLPCPAADGAISEGER
jgi:hypothetical protein